MPPHRGKASDSLDVWSEARPSGRPSATSSEGLEVPSPWAPSGAAARRQPSFGEPRSLPTTPVRSRFDDLERHPLLTQMPNPSLLLGQSGVTHGELKTPV